MPIVFHHINFTGPQAKLSVDRRLVNFSDVNRRETQGLKILESKVFERPVGKSAVGSRIAGFPWSWISVWIIGGRQRCVAEVGRVAVGRFGRRVMTVLRDWGRGEIDSVGRRS